MSRERKSIVRLWLHGALLASALLLQFAAISPETRFAMVCLAIASALGIYGTLNPRPKPTGGITVVGLREYRRFVRWDLVAVGWLILSGAGALFSGLSALAFSLDSPGWYAVAGCVAGTLCTIIALVQMLRTPLHDLPSLDEPCTPTANEPE